MHSSLTPDAFSEALRRAIDPEHRALRLSGYEGDRPIHGEVKGNTFRLQKRRISNNDFAGHFFGTAEPEPGGCKIEAYFAPRLWARYFMRFWVAFAVITGVPLLVSSLREVVAHGMGDDQWVGILVPLVLIFVGTVLPRWTQRFGRGDRRMMIEFVSQVGAAKVDDMAAAVRATSPIW